MDIREKTETIKNSITNRSYHSDEEFFELIDQLKKISNTYNDFIYCSKIEVFIRNKLAAHNHSKGKYKLVQSAIDLNLEYAEKYNDNETFISTYNLAALLNFNLSEYTKALNFFLKGLQVAREINDEYNICKILNNIGDLFYRFKEYKTAYKYFLEANTYLQNKQENQKYFSLIVFTEFNIASSLLVFNKYKQALTHINGLKEFINSNNIKSFEIMVSSLSIAINVKITNNLNTIDDDYQTIINSSKYLTNYSLNILMDIV
jgi:tetratricopeptide (TPR) repeat protein